jgi:two-component system, NtrC family, C4-dicarboxylate transport response regulator DctD
MTRSPLQILLVDDDETNIARLEQALLPLEQAILTAGSGAAALDVMARQSNALGFPGIVVTDLKMPEMSGLDLLRLVVGRDSDVPVIIVSAYGEIATAVEAMRSGAYDFMERPVSVDDLRGKVKRALEKRALVLDNRALRGELANRSGLPMRLIGNSPAMEKLRGEVASIAMTDATVLIHGQTGTGKEVVARAIHDLSPRSKARFVAINCGALSENLIDSELFGHEAGAFTDAKQRRIGLIEYAKGGTLFLDEIESMPLALQVKLLRMLQERTIHRVGGNEEIKVDVRLVAATKTDLLEAAGRREFREDLYFRLGVAELFIPPLNERREDIPLLFTHFLQDFANSYGRDVPRLAREELERLMAHNWRGNVRELRNFAERHVLGLGGKLDGDGLKRRPLPEQMDIVEAAFIQAALAESRGSVQAAADALGVPRRTLSEKMQRLGLARKSFE